MESENEHEALLLLESYEHLRVHPIPYHRLDLKSIRTIPELTPGEIQMILKLRSDYPLVTSWEVLEMQLSSEVMEVLRYSVSLNSTSGPAGDIRWRIKAYGPDDLRWYTRMNYQPEPNIRWICLTERDPGEDRMLDYLIGGMEVSDRWGFDKAVLGGYTLRIGHGLSLGGGMPRRKGSDVIGSVWRKRTAARLNSSSMEHRGFTGILFMKRWRSHSCTVFGARTARNGVIENGIPVLSETGLHQTSLGKIRRHAVFEDFGGIICRLKQKSVETEAYFFALSYRERKTGITTGRAPLGGFTIETSWCNHESAFDADGNYGGVSVFRWGIANFELVLAHRYYSPGFYAPFGAGLSEFGHPDNERGIYIGMEWNLKDFRIFCYLDVASEVLGNSGYLRGAEELLSGFRWRPLSGTTLTVRRSASVREEIRGYEFMGVRYRSALQTRISRLRVDWEYRGVPGERYRLRGEWGKIAPLPRGESLSGFQFHCTTEKTLLNNAYCAVGLCHYRHPDERYVSYVVFMPVPGTLGFIQQRGVGTLWNIRLRYEFRDGVDLNCCWSQSRRIGHGFRTTFTLQLDIAF